MKKILSFFSLALLSIGIAWAATADDLVTISSDYTFIADNFTSNGTVKLEKDQLYDEGRIFANTGNSVASNKGKSKIGEKEYLNSLRVKNVQDQLVFKVAGPCKITFYTQSHATRGLQVGSTEGGTEYGKQEVSATEFTCEIKAAGLVYLSSFGGDFYFAGFSIEFPEEAGKTVTRALIDYPTDKTGATIEGTTAETNVKIHENKDEVPCLQLKNGYTTSDGIMNGNDIKLTVDGGFKKGDVVTIAGAINNSDATKRATAVLFSADSDKKPTVLKKFSDFINGRLVKDDPKEESFTLEEDYDVLYLGRDGGTAASLTLIKVTREEPAEEDPDENLTFAAYTSLDFNSAVNGAVSRGGRHKGDLTTENAAKEGIALPFVISAADATLTIAPNEDATNYPEGSEPCSKFIETVAGPQLLISGGYSGATLTLDKTTTDFNEIKLNLTNWSKKMTAKATNAGADVEGIFDPATGVWKSKNAGETADKIVFTVQADTTWVCESKFKPKDPKKPDGDKVYDGYKLIEVVNHDMGIVKINSIEINPVYDVVVDAVTGTDLAAQIAAAYATIKNPKSLTVNLTAGETYTASSSISLDGSVPFTINGNGATIDASENEDVFIKMTATSTVTANSKGYYVTQPIAITGVTIDNVAHSLFWDNKAKYAVSEFTIDDCVINLTSTSDDDLKNQAIISFQGGGIKDFKLTNSTITGQAKVNYFLRYNGNNGRIDNMGYDKTVDKQTWTYENNTFYQVLKSNGQWGNGPAGQAYFVYSVKNNIWYNSSQDIARRLLNGQLGASSVVTFDKNTYFNEGADKSSNQSNYDKSGTALTTDPGFADAANGDFTLSTTSAQYTNKTGDPRWLGSGSGAITGIEAVKEAKTAEDGAWYTIQGQRVAQPTKGLYIHNGKKVVIK